MSQFRSVQALPQHFAEVSQHTDLGTQPHRLPLHAAPLLGLGGLAVFRHVGCHQALASYLLERCASLLRPGELRLHTDTHDTMTR